MKVKLLRTFSLFIAIIMMFGTVGSYAAAYKDLDSSVDFYNLDAMDVGDKVEYQIIDENGDYATVGVECISSDTDCSSIKNQVTNINAAKATSKGSKTHKVYYTGVAVNCRFYMKVTNNKVTKVYDDWILIIGGTYDNDKLTKASTYGKLTFKVTSTGNLITGKCWLKGTVKGSGNAIKVTWQM